MGCMYVNMDGAPVVSEHVAEGRLTGRCIRGYKVC